MGASILWLPEDPRKPKSLGVGAPSAFIDAMSYAGWRLPCTVTQTDIPKLEGMAAVFGDERDRPNPYQQIIDAIEEHGPIKIWAQY